MRGPGRLFWKVLFMHAAVLGMCLIFWAALSLGEIRRLREQHLDSRLTGRAVMLRETLGPLVGQETEAAIDQRVKAIAAADPDHYRLTMMLPDGRVIAESQADPEAMESHATREEFKAALATGQGHAARPSRTLNEPITYLALRIGPAEAPRGVVRVAVDIEKDPALRAHTREIIWRTVGISAAGLGLFAIVIAGMWSSPVRRLTAAARALSRGDLSARVPARGFDEVGELGRALNEMRDHLAGQLHTIDQQRRILESLLAQLNEGVVVADASGHIMLMNPAAIRLLGVPARAGRSVVEGRSLEECISHPELRELLAARQGGSSATAGQAAAGLAGELSVHVQTDEGEVSLLARAGDIRLPEQDGRAGPARLLVLTDVSQLARAMQMKTDFAANASHELRTPLAAIRGAVETLLGMDLAKDGDSAKEFLGMVDRHAGRMQAMVADLLDLSRLESMPGQFKPAVLHIHPQAAELRARHADALNAHGLTLETRVTPGAEAIMVNPHLLRLVLDNLVDNAIKFTEPGGQITVSFERLEHDGRREARIEVADTGCGIPEDLQDRVFERFFQVEQARSGAGRGTGLGLSIVRHAAAAMGGSVALTSWPNEGTRVSLTFPQPAA